MDNYYEISNQMRNIVKTWKSSCEKYPNIKQIIKKYYKLSKYENMVQYMIQLEINFGINLLIMIKNTIKKYQQQEKILLLNTEEYDIFNIKKKWMDQWSPYASSPFDTDICQCHYYIEIIFKKLDLLLNMKSNFILFKIYYFI